MEYNINLKENFEYTYLHPGDESTIDEFLISYNKDGHRKSKKLLHKLSPFVDKFKLTQNDLLLGIIVILKENFALVESDRIIKKNVYNNVFLLPISEIKNARVFDIKNQLKEKDFVVFKVRSNGKATIIDDELGVILTTCNRCNSQIEQLTTYKGICNKCGLINSRKYSTKYGFANL